MPTKMLFSADADAECKETPIGSYFLQHGARIAAYRVVAPDGKRHAFARQSERRHDAGVDAVRVALDLGSAEIHTVDDRYPSNVVSRVRIDAARLISRTRDV